MPSGNFLALALRCGLLGAVGKGTWDFPPCFFSTATFLAIPLPSLQTCLFPPDGDLLDRVCSASASPESQPGVRLSQGLSLCSRDRQWAKHRANLSGFVRPSPLAREWPSSCVITSKDHLPQGRQQGQHHLCLLRAKGAKLRPRTQPRFDQPCPHPGALPGPWDTSHEGSVPNEHCGKAPLSPGGERGHFRPSRGEQPSCASTRGRQSRGLRRKSWNPSDQAWAFDTRPPRSPRSIVPRSRSPFRRPFLCVY